MSSSLERNGYSSLIACEYLFAVEVAAVRDCIELLNIHLCLGLVRPLEPSDTIGPIVGNHMRDDQVVLRVNRRLDVVADDSSSSRLHRTGIRIRERYLSGGRIPP